MSGDIATRCRLWGAPTRQRAKPLLKEAADALDAKDKRIAELEAALYLAKNDRDNLADNVGRLEGDLEAGGWQPLPAPPSRPNKEDRNG